jgi:predicted transcriptional regulator
VKAERERNIYIYEQRKAGRTSKSIADELGISVQRVRFIADREEQRVWYGTPTYCELYKCEDCPRYGDDCDGKGEDETDN